MAQLILAQEVISKSFTNKNTLELLIKENFIEVAQEQHIRPVLGDDFYDEIVKQNNDNNLSVDNKKLLDDFIKDALAFYVKFEVLDDISFNTTSKGVRSIDDEFTSPATDTQRANLALKIRSHADTLRDKMIRFIEDEDNIDNYPTYKKFENITKSVTTFGGIVLTPGISDIPIVPIEEQR